MRRLNLGIVGCGSIASYMALICRLEQCVHLAACCDPDPDRVNQFASKFHIRHRFTDYGDLLDLTEVDAVYLAVPHDLHAEMTLKAVKTGKAVLTEKPLTRSFQEGQDLLSALSKTNVKVGVNYQYRYDSACYRLARLVQSGELGEIFSARINLPWSRRKEYFTQSSWHDSLTRSGGGTLLTQASHFLDIVLWAMSDMPISAFAKTQKVKFTDVDVEDLAVGQVHCQNGAIIQVHSTMAAAREEAVSIEMYGTRGSVIYKNLPRSHLRIRGTSAGKYPVPRFGFHALQRSLGGFCDWVLFEKPYLIPAEEALPVLAVVDALYRSAANGREEEIIQLK